ncbi:MAG: ABC transporter substrate-binding protein [Desulfatibacillaceae bacterium]
MKKTLTIFCIILLSFSVGSAMAAPKILYIDSYHEGYAWSDGITEGVREALDGKADVRVHRMDTKRNSGEEYKVRAALDARKAIEEYNPDVVIVSDDNASKYVVREHYYNADLPFVFCGLNWDASEYGFPTDNVTGMVEVTPVDQLIALLGDYAKGDRIGFLGIDRLTSTKEAKNIEKVFGLDLVKYFSEDEEDWKKGFLELQDKVDMIVVDSDGGLYDDSREELAAFVEKNTTVPTGACYDFMTPYVMITFGKIAQEQGYWAADNALAVATGDKAIKDIEVVTNKEGSLGVNIRVASKLGVDLPYRLIGSASQVIE